MIKSKIVHDLNQNCEYSDGKYSYANFDEWTEDDINFDNDWHRSYCHTYYEKKEGYWGTYQEEIQELCTTCSEILNKHKLLHTINNNSHEILFEKIFDRLNKIETTIDIIKKK